MTDEKKCDMVHANALEVDLNGFFTLMRAVTIEDRKTGAFTEEQVKASGDLCEQMRDLLFASSLPLPLAAVAAVTLLMGVYRAYEHAVGAEQAADDVHGFKVASLMDLLHNFAGDVDLLNMKGAARDA